MFSGEVSPEEEKKYITKIADLVDTSGFNDVAIWMLKAHKPLSFIIGSIGRITLLPYSMLFGYGNSTGKLISIFEDESKVEKLIKILESTVEEKNIRDQEREKASKGDKDIKKGWRRFLPF